MKRWGLAGLLLVAVLVYMGVRMAGHREAFALERKTLDAGAGARRPVVAASVAGGLYVLEAGSPEKKDALFLRMSQDAGDRWMPAAQLSADGASVVSSSENAPELMARGMYVYALWQERVNGGTRLQVARRSGMEMQPVAAVNPVDKSAEDKSYSGFASMGIAPKGDLYVVWLDGRDTGTPGTFSVYLARSSDKGMTFGKNVKVAEVACPCCRPSVAFGEGGAVYVAYRHVYSENERDIAVAASRDGGATFGAPVRVASDAWKLLGCPESGPKVAVQGKDLVVAWFTAGAARRGIFVARSKDGGKTFEEPQLASGEVQQPNHPYLSQADDGTLALAFSGRVGGKKDAWSEVQPFVLLIGGGGRIAAPQAVGTVAEGGRYPTVALAGDRSVYVAWSHEEDGGSRSYLARGLER